MRFFTKTAVGAATTAVLLVIAAGLASANDTIFPDGDTGVASPNLHYGPGNRDCTTRGTAVDGQITVNYNGSGTDPSHHFTPGESLAVSLAPNSTSITTTLGTVPNVPSDWGSSPGDSFTIPFTTSVLASLASGTYFVEVTVTGNTSGYSAGDGSGSPGKPKYNVIIDSDCPTVSLAAEAGGPYAGAEGSAIALSGSATNVTGTPSYSWSVDTTGGDSGISCSFSPNSLAQNPSVTCNDDSNGGTFTLTLTVTDSVTSAQDTASLTVTNANPSVNTPTVTSQSNCSVNISASFTDAGTNDTHTASINWGDSNVTSGTVSELGGAGTVTGSHSYSAAGPYDIYVTVTDDDLGSGTNATALHFDNTPTVGWPQAPILLGNGGTKTFNTGSTIPVKIKVNGCTAGLGTVTLSVTPTVTTVKSSGKSNLLTYLRYTPSLPGYIYNWDTTGWTANITYTVTVTFQNVLGSYNTTVKLVK